MTDCPNAEMRDLLPDWVNGQLAFAVRGRVDAHLAGCTDCRAEVALLSAARRVLPGAPPVDVATIVAALPPPPAEARVSSRPATATRTASGARQWRAAAAVVAVALGASALAIRGADEGATVVPPSATLAADSPMRTAPGVSVAGPAAADDLSASPLLAYVDAGELTPAEYDELVYALEVDSDVFTPVAEPPASLTGGTE